MALFDFLFGRPKSQNIGRVEDMDDYTEYETDENWTVDHDVEDDRDDDWEEEQELDWGDDWGNF